MAQAVQGLLDQGADLVVLACTEAPIALAAVPGDLRARCVDSTLALAEATVMLWQQSAAGSGLRRA
jgi:aspartate racemase